MHDIDHLNSLRQDAEWHHVDYSRVKRTVTEGGGYNLTFDTPVVPLGAWAEHAPDRHVHARSAEGCEIAMLSGLIRLHVAERRAVRTGAVCGWTGAQIARTPLTPEEIANHKSRTSPAKQIAKLEQELCQALAKQAARAAAVKGAAALDERYGPAVAHVQATETKGPAISGKPAKRQRAKSE